MGEIKASQEQERGLERGLRVVYSFDTRYKLDLLQKSFFAHRLLAKRRGSAVWGYTNKACLRRLNALLTLLVRVGGLGLYSRDFNRQVFCKRSVDNAITENNGFKASSF